jgi:chitin synthase
MILKHQKYTILSSVFLLNTLLISTFIYFSDYWYAYIFILASESLINSSASILILLNKLLSSHTNKYILPKKYLYVVPCYNESEEELTNTLQSLVNQKNVEFDNRLLFIVCDGCVKGIGNDLSTDKILKKILNIHDTADYYDYNTWDNKTNTIKSYNGTYLNLDYILFIKEKNYGKRDSLVLVRKLCYAYNNTNNNDDNENNTNNSLLFKDIIKKFTNIFNEQIDYIIGIDADTVFEPNCTKELIKGIESLPGVYGCVGYVDISPKMYPYSLWTLYQYGEYMYSQCLKRYAQSVITHKVNCLSGCNQILKVTKETCGDEILNLFNRLPKEDENIFNHIRSYASEDRNHVCLMLSKYPYVKTVQNINAKAYTIAPNTVSVFLSQRRRWNLGANCNDMLLTYLPGINIFERISSFVNILTFVTSPFILVATAYFLKILFTDPPFLMLYLSIVMIIPFMYSILIPIVIMKSSFKNTLYYYLSYSMYLIFGSIVNIITYSYALINIDTIKWGKTRTINETSSDISSTSTSTSTDVSINSLINNFDIYINKKKINEDSNEEQYQEDPYYSEPMQIEIRETYV